MIKKRRILFITKTDGLGGTEIHLKELVKRIDREKFDITVVCLKKNPYAKLFEEEGLKGINIIDFSQTQTLISFAFLLLKIRPNIVTFIKGGFNIYPWWLYIVPSLCGIFKVYAIEHSSDQPDFKKYLINSNICKIKQIYKETLGWVGRRKIRVLVQCLAVSKTICVADVIRNNLIKNLQFTGSKVVTVHNGINVDYFVPCKGDITDDQQKDKTLLCVARLTELKGIDDLLEALFLLKKNKIFLKLIIVGDGPYKSNLEEKTVSLGLSLDVCFTDFQKDIRPFLNKSSIFVLPSYQEGLPLTLLEAMASGIPCVATRVGGNAEVVIDGQTGYLIEMKDIKGLAMAISDLATNSTKREAFSRRSRERILEFFEINNKMNEVLDIILRA